MNWVRHGSSTTFETKSSYCRVARQSLPCYPAVFFCRSPDDDRIVSHDAFSRSITQYRSQGRFHREIRSFSRRFAMAYERSFHVETFIFIVSLSLHFTKCSVTHNTGHPTTVFWEISVRRSKYCLEFSITWGRLKISRWPFHQCTIFEAYLLNSLRFSVV